MALTDNSLTVEEFETAYAANPALKDVALNIAKKLGYTPYTAAEFETALGTKIGEKTSELYTGLDNDIFSASGIAKEGTEKTYDYAKRVIGGLKSAPTTLQTKIAELERERQEAEEEYVRHIVHLAPMMDGTVSRFSYLSTSGRRADR